MFCSKCGKELPDNAAFCSECGNQVGAAPQVNAQAQPAQSAGMPPILEKLIGQTLSLFVKKDPVGAVAETANDKTWSGAIVAVVGILMYALAAMVNVNQTILGLVKQLTGGIGGALVSSQVSKMFPSGTTFGLSLLTGVVVFVVSVLAVFVAVKFLLKKDISLSASLNIVAYSSLPMVIVFILNMLLGLIWWAIPMVLSIIVVISTLLLIYSAINHIYGSDTNSFPVYLIVVAVIVIVALAFIGITAKGVSSSLVNSVGSGISNFF